MIHIYEPYFRWDTLFFTEIRLIESIIPVGYREAWARANSETNRFILGWVEDAEPDTIQHDCAFFCHPGSCLLLHKLLLRASPRSRGRGRPNK